MAIDRLSRQALQQIIDGSIKEDATCVIKFYSNECHLCHALQEYYFDISQDAKYDDLHFFAFNIDDYPAAEDILKFQGVPTICVAHTNIGKRKSTFRIMPEPEKPNEKTWYKVRDIKSFINREAL
ncbi:hypothetical protein CMI37_01310 [Candidatus Pacearchaeota archaeon]|nr:hypothetical protein [Candidatus Pacearchaeota archaeon]|tara:strand:+ start:965 stop:1339 length:375 start_codon:yes stop_codon:yes gene_type:complete